MWCRRWDPGTVKDHEEKKTKENSNKVWTLGNNDVSVLVH